MFMRMLTPNHAMQRTPSPRAIREAFDAALAQTIDHYDNISIHQEISNRARTLCESNSRVVSNVHWSVVNSTFNASDKVKRFSDAAAR